MDKLEIKKLQERECKECKATGVKYNYILRDVAFNPYKCEACNGTGFIADKQKK